MLTFLVNGVQRTYDNSRLMFSEAMEIQKATGLTAKAFETGLSDGDVLAYGALFWLTELRGRMAATPGLTLKDAIAALPFATWDVNLSESIPSVRNVEEPDPTQPPQEVPSGPTEPTSQGTSEAVSPETTWSADAAPISEPSPSSSESAPGSGSA